MSDYSIETASHQIYDARTRAYFEEVYGSYTSSHYRSAVVMLWTVIVCDVFFKLDQLSNAHGDATATQILSEIGDLRKNNPKSPDWELALIQQCASKTNLIDQAEFTHLESIQKHRHLSAHPVLKSGDVLFSPNKETTRAHIRNALDAVLTKPPIMSKKVFDAFMEDIESLSKMSPTREDMKRFLEAKYFSHFTSSTLIAVFRSLWRLVLKSADEKCEANREINAVALAIMYEKSSVECHKEIAASRDWFSDISLDESHLDCLIAFLQEFPAVYRLFTDAVRAPLTAYADANINNFTVSWFVDESPAQHFQAVLEKLKDHDVAESFSKETFQRLCVNFCEEPEQFTSVLDLAVFLYGACGYYDTADSRFASMIRPYLNSFSEEQFQRLLAGSEGNSQTLDRHRAGEQHREMQDSINQRFSNFDFDPYPRFVDSID